MIAAWLRKKRVQNSAYRSACLIFQQFRHLTCSLSRGVVYRMSNYVVTGGAGFIGSHIAEELLRRKQSVKIVDNFSTGKRENLKTLKDAEVISTDISRAPDLAGIFSGADYVIHQAAIPSVPKSMI